MLVGVLTFMIVGNGYVVAQDVIVYAEDFESGPGIANYPDWEIGAGNGEGPESITQVIGEKVDQIRVQNKTPFERGDDLMVEFKLWGDSSHSWGGPTFPAGRGIAGPWHSQPGMPNNKPDRNKKVNDTVEAGVNWWHGAWNSARWEENGLRDDPDLDPEDNLPAGHGTVSGPVADDNWQSALHSATSKDNCLTIRVHLGNLPPTGTGGGFFEYSTEGVNFSGLRSKGGPLGGGDGALADVLLDSRAPGYDPPPNDLDQDGNGVGHKQIPGTASPCYIAFGAGSGAQTGSHFYDDFVITTQLPPPNQSRQWMIYN